MKLFIGRAGRAIGEMKNYHHTWKPTHHLFHKVPIQVCPLRIQHHPKHYEYVFMRS